jgi:N-acetylglutamate synthase-like GNAT family acetyltransferase
MTDNANNVVVRPATAEDQDTIEKIIREADINPMGLEWQRFVVAELDGQIVGTGQIKPHGDGVRELASIATRPGFQKRGIATQIIQALLARESEPLYLMCEQHNETFYHLFGFRRIKHNDMPKYFRRMVRLVSLMLPVYRLVTRQQVELVIMKQTEPNVNPEQ